MTTPTVFISYSHKDEAWKDSVLPHLRALDPVSGGILRDSVCYMQGVGMA